jgi:hypothetical protein
MSTFTQIGSHAARWIVLGLAAAFGAAACGGRVAQDFGVTGSPEDAAGPIDGSTRESRDASADACAKRLSASVAEHACSHGTEGPFASVVPNASGEGASVSQVHVSYRVLFAAAPFEGTVEYRPARDGQHAIFVENLEVLDAIDRDGGRLTVQPTTSALACSVFDGVYVMEAPIGSTVLLKLRSNAQRARLFVEHLGSFERPWTPSCGEGG